MEIFKGKGISKGIAIGNLFWYSKTLEEKKYEISNPTEEYSRFLKALNKADKELETLYTKALNTAGEEQAEIFSIQRMMIGDPDFCEIVETTIKEEKINAEFAVDTAAKTLSKRLKESDNEYMQARALDVFDSANKLKEVLRGKKPALPKEERIIAADELLPSDTIRIKRDDVLAFITRLGSANSHMSILSRSMGIPAIILDEDLEKYNGAFCIVDGESGEVIISPTADISAEYNQRLESILKEKAQLDIMCSLPSITLNGDKCEIYANIGSLSEAKMAKDSGAEGIGLFRTEFLFLGRNAPPDEEEQFEIYKSVASLFSDEPIIIRTLDIGADKCANYFGLPKEENPALGYRGIRVFLDREDISMPQLRAILRASVYGNIKILLPMIVSLTELRKARALIDKAKTQLQREGKSFNLQIDIGIMAETPAAAIMTEELCTELDFISIGTNDLTQYTLAADRQNSLVEHINNNNIPVLRLIKYIVDVAKRKGKWVGICGELAADKDLSPFFVSLGIKELSVATPHITQLRKNIRSIDIDSRKEVIKAALLEKI